MQAFIEFRLHGDSNLWCLMDEDTPVFAIKHPKNSGSGIRAIGASHRVLRLITAGPTGSKQRLAILVRANASKSGKRWLKTLALLYDFLA